MDEPTAALNEAETNELFAIIRRLKADGVSVVYINHKMDGIRRISDRVTVMRDSAMSARSRPPITRSDHHHDGRALDHSIHHHRPDLSAAPVVLSVRASARAAGARCQPASSCGAAKLLALPG